MASYEEEALLDEEEAILLEIAKIELELEDEEDEEEFEQMPKRRRWWVRPLLSQRSTEGYYDRLICKILRADGREFKNFMRISFSDFEFLLNLVTPLIKKQDTNMRQSIPAGCRLALTLRYLAAGEEFTSLQYQFLVSLQSITNMIPETLDAIYEVLYKDYLRVNIKFYLIFDTFRSI